VVSYVVDMKKDAAVVTETTVRSAIVKNGGNFAGYSVDVQSIKASGTCVLHEATYNNGLSAFLTETNSGTI